MLRAYRLADIHAASAFTWWGLRHVNIPCPVPSLKRPSRTRLVRDVLILKTTLGAKGFPRASELAVRGTRPATRRWKSTCPGKGPFLCEKI